MQSSIIYLLPLFVVTLCGLDKPQKWQKVRLDVVKVQTARMRWRNQTERKDLAGFDFFVIPKTMSTITKLVLCDVTLRQRRMPKLDLTAGGNPCISHNWYRGYPKEKLLWKMPETRPNIIIFRDPVQRFVSMFSYLCKSRRYCDPRMNIHEFAKSTYTILRKNRMIPGFNDGREIFRHIQPSFWFAYNVSRTFPPNPLVLYPSLDLNENADQLRDALVQGKVPLKVATEAVGLVRRSFVNTIEANGHRNDKLYRIWEHMVYQRRETLLYVLASYYNDYRLLKVELPEKLLSAANTHGITLPDPVEEHHGKKLIKDKCGTVPRHRTADGREIPLHPC